MAAEAISSVWASRADTIKTALLRAVSHDLRSPLTAISAAGDAIASPTLSADERSELASVIQEETARLSRLEAGAAEPHRSWTSIEELIRACVQDAGGGEAYNLAIDHDIPLLSIDPVQMERALVNVLENARRYSGGHPVSVRARTVRQLGGEAGDRVIIRIVDRGPGIPPAQLERVFEPFYRAGSQGGEHRGSGLGLAIARGFAEANEGTLHVESLPGQGATFVFEFRLREGEGPGVDALDSEPAAAGSMER